MKTLMKLTGAAALSSTVLLGSALYAQTPEDTLVMAWTLDEFITLDPAAVAEQVPIEVVQNMCDPLLQMDSAEPAVVRPSVAESWTISDDARTYTFTIREGMTFPSGNPVTAEDVVWSLRRVLQLNLANASQLTEWGWSAETAEEDFVALDDRTVQITTPRPYAPNLMLNVFTKRAASTLDRQLLLENEVDGDLGNAWLATRSACVGPYSLQTWLANETVILQANESYWGGEPEMQRIIIRHVPEAGAQRLLLERGDIDVARIVNASDAAELDAMEGFTVSATPIHAYYYIGLNAMDEAFQDERVRLAFRYLVDYASLQDSLMAYAGQVRQSVVPNGAFGAIPADEMPFELDLDRARALLSEAGLEDGFSRTLIVENFFPVLDLATHLQANAAEAGIDLQIQAAAGSQVYGQMRSRDFDLGVFRWSTGSPDANGMLSRHAYNPDNSQEANLTMFPAWRVGWDTSAYNDEVEALQLELDDEVRIDAYQAMQRRHMQESPMIYMFQQTRNMAFGPSVAGVEQNAFRMYYTTFDKN